MRSPSVVIHLLSLQAGGRIAVINGCIEVIVGYSDQLRIVQFDSQRCLKSGIDLWNH